MPHAGRREAEGSNMSDKEQTSTPARHRRALSELRPIPRRGLSRTEAAIYYGVSPSKFDQMVDDALVGLARFLFDDAEHEFLVNHAMDDGALGGFGNEDIKTVFFDQAVAIKGLLHREARTEQANALDPGGLNGFSRWIGQYSTRSFSMVEEIAGSSAGARL